MGYINNLFTGQTDSFGVAVSESSHFLSIDSISGHPAVYRHLKPCGNADENKIQKKNL